MSADTRHATLDEFVDASADASADAEPDSEPAWTPREDGNSACERCGGHVAPAILRVIGVDGRVPVCKRCYVDTERNGYDRTVNAVQDYRDRQDRGASECFVGTVWREL